MRGERGCVRAVRLGVGLASLVLAGALLSAVALGAEGGYRTLDLRAVVNMGWRDDAAGDGKGGWTDQGATDMRNVEPGRREFLGIPFDLVDPAKNAGKAVLTLKAGKFPAGPASATVRVGAAAKSIYFLHASAWTGGHMATYVVRYGDGASAEIPIRARQEITDWWAPTHGERYRVAFHVPNPVHDDLGMVVFGWDNPSPEKTIESIEFRSENADGIVVIAAVTLSDAPVSLPAAADIPLPDYLKSDKDTLDLSQWFVVGPEDDPFEPTPIDQAATLDAPAGKHGFMENVDGHWVFEDGTPVRLVAVMHSPFAPATKEDAEYVARWLAKWGFNMVRLGHLVVSPDPRSALDWTRPDTQHLNADVMDRMDYFIAKLAEQGIYTRLSMIWYRKLKKADGVEDFDATVAYQQEKSGQTPRSGEDPVMNSVGITFFDPRVMALNIELEKAIMTHRNPYRNNMMYGEDPAICQTEVTNEDSMFFYTIDGISPYYQKKLDRLWSEWLLKKYGSREKLSAAWGADLGEGESLEDGTVKRLQIWEFREGLGPKLPRARDQLRFYFELTSGYFLKTKEALRAAGVRQPICGTGWHGGGLTYWAEVCSNVPGLDYTDRHQYWAGGPGGWQILSGQPFNCEAALTKPEMMLKLSLERALGLPFGISEWANVLPNRWRLEAPALMAFYGNCLNGWDAPIHFAHSVGSGAGRRSFIAKLHWMWPVNEPSTLCQYPAVSQIIRRGDVREGDLAFVRNFSDDEVFGALPLKDVAIKFDVSGPYEMSAEEGVNARSLAAIYAAAVGKTGIRFSKEDTPDFSIDLNRYIDLTNHTIRSATGELFWDYGTGYFTANTTRTQAAVGFITDLPISLDDCEIRSGNRCAAVLVTSWDGAPLKESKHILITAVGQVRNADMEYSRGGQRLLVRGEQGPVLLEGVKGSVTLNRAGTCTVTALSPHGYKTTDVAPRAEGGRIVIPMDGRNKAAYYDVRFP